MIQAHHSLLNDINIQIAHRHAKFTIKIETQTQTRGEKACQDIFEKGE